MGIFSKDNECIHTFSINPWELNPSIAYVNQILICEKCNHKYTLSIKNPVIVCMNIGHDLLYLPQPNDKLKILCKRCNLVNFYSKDSEINNVD